MWLFNHFNFERNYVVLKSKSSCILLNKNININKNETESKIENPTHSFRETKLGFSSYKNRKLKVKLQWVRAREKKESILSRLFCPKEIFLTFVIYLNAYYVEFTFRKYILWQIKKHYFIHFCCLFLKSSKAFSVSLWIDWSPCAR